MAKIISLALIICALIITGCGSEESELKIGMIKYLNVTEDELNNTLHSNNQSLKQRHIFFDNLPSMIGALESGQIDGISSYKSVATYLMAHNPDIQWEPEDKVTTNVFCFAMRNDESELQKEFNEAINIIAKNGKLLQLVKEYVNEFTHMDEPPAVEMPTLDNAPIIKVGVTGDLPALDYIRADGKPAGFNTALLAEIRLLTKKNFTIIQIDSGARAAALNSGKVDVIFWAVMPQSDSIFPVNFDKPENVIFTKAYFTDDIVHVRMKK